jgi:hypothetical protein
MAHYAEIENGKVTRVIVADNAEWCKTNLGGTWVQTSYNTQGNVHALGGTPLHKNYAGIGYTWDGVGFAAPQPFASWQLNATSYIWEAPIPMPTDGKKYEWIEADKKWRVAADTPIV